MSGKCVHVCGVCECIYTRVVTMKYRKIFDDNNERILFYLNVTLKKVNSTRPKVIKMYFKSEKCTEKA